MMQILDEKLITLNDGDKDVVVKVYIKEVMIKSSHKSKKVFSRIVKDAL